MSVLARITVNSQQCGGCPCIGGMRIRVSDVLDLLGAGVEVDAILADYTDVEREDVYAALLWAARYVDHPRYELPTLLAQITPDTDCGKSASFAGGFTRVERVAKNTCCGK